MLAASSVCICVVLHFSAHTADSYRSLGNLSPPFSFWVMRKMLPSNGRRLLYWTCWCSVTYTFSALFIEKNYNKDESDFHLNMSNRHKRSSWIFLFVVTSVLFLVINSFFQLHPCFFIYIKYITNLNWIAIRIDLILHKFCKTTTSLILPCLL